MDDLKIEFAAGTRPGVKILRLSGPFTLSTMFDFQNLVREDRPPVTIIDLGGVPYMDSAALGAVLGVHASCQREGRKYALVAVPDRIQTLLKVIGVENIVVRYGTVAEAEEKLTGTAVA
jgi:anti-sigma B factor antagonist